MEDEPRQKKRHFSGISVASFTSFTEPKYVSTKDENQVRGNWSGKLDFILSCLSYAVGLGNVWRFPYQCYKNGGGAFVFPFVLMLFITGFPLFFLESAFGQYASSGVISIWRASPIFQGVGCAMFLISFFVSLYYNVIIAWTFFYLFASFRSPLPWSTCGNWWNTPACYVRGLPEVANCTSYNGTWYNDSCVTVETHGQEYFTEVTDLLNVSAANISQQKSPSDEYFHRYVLQLSEGFHTFGNLRWQIVLCLMLAWFLVCTCMIKGIKSSGRAVYFTSTFPYLVLTILLIRGLTLPGSIKGILYYITPQWHMLLSPRVWCDAAVQIFFSLAPGWGGLITLSSYNKFKNNCLRDTYIVCVGDVVTSIFAGLVIFSIIGYMSEELQLPIKEVASEGAGLAFVVYPEVVTHLPLSPVWAVLFFLMLITLGLGTQFAIVNTVHTTLIDTFPNFFHQGRRPSYLMMGLCLLGFLLGLTCASQGGMYMLQLMDAYAASYSVLFVAFTECVALSWVYGYDQVAADIKLMLGFRIGIYWKIMWKFISPAFLLAIMVFTWVDFKPTSYREYEFPWWAEGLGLCISITSILCIPLVALYKIITYNKNVGIIQRIKELSRPTEDWGPALFRNPTSPCEVEMEHRDVKLPLNPSENTLQVQADIPNGQ